MSGTEPGDCRLPATRRLRESREFTRIKTAGRRLSLGCLLINWETSADPARTGPRLGLVVSRKVGGAVMRNRVKRWLREVFRLHRRHLPQTLDLVVVARPAIAKRCYRDVQRDLIAALRQAQLWEERTLT